MSKRVRFAPSPTGSLHLGNARTALVNWLVARRQGGVLVLRIEDTDDDRNQAGAEERIMADLRWLGVSWDEGPDVGGPFGPYRQSERRRRYDAVIAELLARGAAYYCFADPLKVRDERAAALAAGDAFAWPCRDLQPSAAQARFAAGERAAVRLRAPERPVRFVDGLRGETGLEADQIGDFVLARPDGSPTYQLAVVADDHDMQIDHVVRGQDHLANTPGQLLLYEAMGWEVPRFTHLPLVLGEDRSRLSKRHGATSVEAMRSIGVIGEAVANALALLGWAPPAGEEIMSLDAMAAAFDLEGLSPTNAVFDYDKLEWVCQQHLQRLSGSELLGRAEPFLEAAGLHPHRSGRVGEWWRDVAVMCAPSLHRLDQMPQRMAGIFWSPTGPSEIEISPEQRAAMRAFVACSASGVLASDEEFRRHAREIGKETGVRGRDLFHPFRELVSGQDAGPELAQLVPLIESGAQLGVEPPVSSVAERLRVGLGEAE